jgi:GrpB-like predicted nucleotidyltransferase (UPF0157 family)
VSEPRQDAIVVIPYDPAWPASFEAQRGTDHVHLVEERSADWPTWLAFRDHLRGHPADAAGYARLKRELAAADQHDRPAYRAGKAAFIQERLRRITAHPTPKRR